MWRTMVHFLLKLFWYLQLKFAQISLRKQQLRHFKVKTISKSEVKTIHVHKTKPPAGEMVRIQIAHHFGCILAPYWWLDGYFFLVIFEPTVLRLVSSSFTQKLCTISNTEQRRGWLNNKYWQLGVHFVLMVWLQLLFVGNQNANGWSSRKED